MDSCPDTDIDPKNPSGKKIRMMSKLQHDDLQ